MGTSRVRQLDVGYNEVTADMRVNPMSNVWDGNLWQQAIFSEKKQTFHPINGLIGQMI